MKRYPINNFSSGNQILSSLVVNPPYKTDGFTTSPTIPKILDLPLGVRINSAVLVRSFLQLMISLTAFMLSASVCICCFYLPVENQNNQLTSEIRTLTNQNLGLLANLQETTSYNRLFSGADALSLVDSEETIYINANTTSTPKQIKRALSFKKYPSIQFAGF